VHGARRCHFAIVTTLSSSSSILHATLASIDLLRFRDA
jgi:hypothetical protein